MSKIGETNKKQLCWGWALQLDSWGGGVQMSQTKRSVWITIWLDKELWEEKDKASENKDTFFLFKSKLVKIKINNPKLLLVEEYYKSWKIFNYFLHKRRRRSKWLHKSSVEMSFMLLTKGSVQKSSAFS